MVCDNDVMLELKDISLTIGKRKILNQVNLKIKKGKITVIWGKSGSGKSTLLNVMNMLYIPNSGQYSMDGETVSFKDEDYIARKREKIGFFHQELALLEDMTIKENMDIFSEICRQPINNVMLENYLDLLELGKLYEENVSLLSGGERQRAAFLKLLIIPYEIIFIDEPTNNLDSENIQVIRRGINQLKEQGKTVVVVSLILINICLEMISFNYSNMQNGLLDNDCLKLLQVFGENRETNDMNLDEEAIMDVNHVLFEVKTYPITMDLYDKDGEAYIDDVIFLYKIPKEYGRYVGIEGMLEDDVIYCPEGSISKEALANAAFADEFRDLGIKLEEYDGCPPQMLEGNQFATEATYEKVMAVDRERIGSEYADVLYSTPQYLVGVDDTVHVYDVVDRLKTAFPGYEIQVSYQASGLRNFVENSSNMMIFQILAGAVIVMISFVIIYVFANAFISKQEKNMMILYINGMTRKSITNQLYQWMMKCLLKPGICVVFLAGISYIILSRFVFKTSFHLAALLIILLINMIVEFASIKFLKWSIGVKIESKTANSNITAMLRN